MRHLIRTGDETNIERLNQLLQIPSLERMACDNSNELLRLAIRLSNRPAITRLLSIPSVRTLAARNNYYQDEAEHGINLAEIARNAESSMIALSQNEKQNLVKVESKYRAIIEQRGGNEAIFQALIEHIKTGYLKAPAK